MMRKYDDFDYHASAALDGGQPEENGFTHIGFFLAWLIRHSLIDDEFSPDGLAHDLDAGRVLPNELSDLFDGKLVSMMLTDEGAAFADAYYARYLDEYAAEFAGLPDYAVPDDPEHEARAAALIDRAYAEWVIAGRPEPDATREPDLSAIQRTIREQERVRPARTGLPTPPNPTREEILAAMEEMARSPGGHVVIGREMDQPSLLEVRLTRAVAAKIDWQTLPGTSDGSVMRSLRALKAFGVKPEDIVLVTGMGPIGDPVIQVFEVPGVPARSLFPEFQRAELGRRIRWREERLDGMAMRLGRMALGRGEEPWEMASFAVDGYAVYLTVREGGLERLNEIARSLRAALEAPAG